MFICHPVLLVNFTSLYLRIITKFYIIVSHVYTWTNISQSVYEECWNNLFSTHFTFWVADIKPTNRFAFRNKIKSWQILFPYMVLQKGDTTHPLDEGFHILSTEPRGQYLNKPRTLTYNCKHKHTQTHTLTDICTPSQQTKHTHTQY